MNVWLVPVRPQSWRVIKRKGVFGLPRIDHRVRLGDLIVFHVLKPVNGIVAVGKIASNAYEDRTDFWGPDKYPFRFRVEFIFEYSETGGKVIPLSAVYGETNNPDISIEPFFKNVWITKITEQQYEKLRQYLLSTGRRI